MKPVKYYSMSNADKSDKTVDIYIFGDIVCPEDEWYESDTSGFSLVKDIKDLNAEVINVHINSYGGHVSEGLAIYNTLKRHKAKIVTYDDGFACSAASVVFVAGDERIMNNASLLMIHNAWNVAIGNANDLRKAAADLDKIMQASVNAYMEVINITEEELKALLDDETWLTPQEALEMGFATTVISASGAAGKTAANARKALYSLVMRGLAKTEPVKDPPAEPPETDPVPPADPPAEPPETDPVPPADPPAEPEPPETDPAPGTEQKLLKFITALGR